VSGYGVLGLYVAYRLYTEASWEAYFLGLFLIGYCDLAFTFLLLLSGVIKMDAGSVGGPVIWVLAVGITPFGLSSLFTPQV
jgi:hypothetical protein